MAITSFFVNVVRNVFDCREGRWEFGGPGLNKQASIIQETGLFAFLETVVEQLGG